MAKTIEYQLQDINTRDIVIDDLGQRDVNRRRSQFNKIMREFDPNLIQPISVAQIDGKYYCFDGQMTMKVLKAKNADRDLCVKCRVYRGMTKMDAANMFINQRGIVSKVNLAEKIRVKANYGDERAISFQNTIEKNGMEISWAGNISRNSIVAVSTLWDEFRMFKDDELFGSFIRVIKGAWDGDHAGSQAKILKGLGLFMRSYKGQAKEEILVQKLRGIHPNEIIRNASADRTTGPGNMPFKSFRHITRTSAKARNCPTFCEVEQYEYHFRRTACIRPVAFEGTGFQRAADMRQPQRHLGKGQGKSHDGRAGTGVRGVYL